MIKIGYSRIIWNSWKLAKESAKIWYCRNFCVSFGAPGVKNQKSVKYKPF